MMAVKLATCLMPKDPLSPIPVGGGIRGGLRDILRVRVWCAITLIPPLFVVVLWPGTASPDPLGDPPYHVLCIFMRGLHED
jgi:hypothetical protein